MPKFQQVAESSLTPRQAGRLSPRGGKPYPRRRGLQSRQGVLHFRVKGKRGKVRFVPVQVLAQRLIEEYLALAGHSADASGAVFRPVTNNRTGDLDRPLDPASVYQNIVRKYGLETGISAQVNGLCVHSLRATAATNARLSHEADIAKVQGVARPRQRLHHEALRPAEDAARG